jgi:hypothetical protein
MFMQQFAENVKVLVADGLNNFVADILNGQHTFFHGFACG